MPPKYRYSHADNGLEKSALSEPLITQGRVENDRRSCFTLPFTDGNSFLGTTAAGVANCLASLSPCQPSAVTETPTAFEAVLTVSAEPAALTETSQYVNASSYTSSSRAVSLAQVGEPYNDAYHPPVENWLSDDTAEATRYMQGFPALQPTIAAPTNAASDSQLTRIQPNTHAESMYYPNEQAPPPNNFPKTEVSDVQMMSSVPAATLPVSNSAPLPTSQLQDCVSEVPISTAYSQSLMPVEPTGQLAMSPPILLSASVPFDTTAMLSTAQTTAANVGPLPVGPPMTATSVAFTPAVAPQYASPAPNTTMEPQHHPHSDASAHGQMPVVPYEASFDVSVQPLPRPPAARRGPFKDQNDRQKTAQTRKDGSCIRCRMQRIRCNAKDPDNPKGECQGCHRSVARTWRLPCLRLKIVDVVLSKTSQVKGHEWTLRWKDNTVLDDVGHWASSEVRIVRITEGYTNEFVELRVRRFIPQDGDSLDRSWVTPNGQSRSVRIPPYAVIEPESIAPQYSSYIKKGLIACCTNVLSDQKDTLLWPTYWIAVNMSRGPNRLTEPEHSLLSNTLDLWMTVRLTTRSFEIVGNETLDMPVDILDETSPSHGKIPIPPVMGAQLDSVLIHQIQHNLKHKVLDGLGKMVTENKTRTWFTTYLVTFILLHNAALVIKHDASYAKKHGMKRRFAREDKVQQYYTGAITLLAYFHYCNKGVFPFTESARDQDLRNLANLDGESMQFVQYTRKYAIANKSKWQAMLDANNYEDDFYFISQLFEVNWQPRSMVI